MTSESTPQPTCAAIVIGNELLSGKIADENTPFIARELRAIGVRLARVEIVQDIVANIVDAVQRNRDRHDFLITTGGVGPTHDDVTMEALSLAFGVPLVEHPEIASLVRAWRPNDLALLRVALVPEGSRLHWGNDKFWPLVQVGNVFVFPGVPKLVRAKFQSLRALYAGAPVACCSVYFQVGESELVAALDTVLSQCPEVEVGSYPRTGDGAWLVRITLEHQERALVETATQVLVRNAPPAGDAQVVWDG
jgi:molybdenum cofactor synthesis domain-containing protein